jgi:2-isopropylmalate synthase
MPRMKGAEIITEYLIDSKIPYVFGICGHGNVGILDTLYEARDRIKLVSLTVIAGTHGPQRATMKLDVEGQMKIEEAEGNGPVDAVFNCIKLLVPHEAKLELYQVHAVTEGTDAQAEVSVRLAHEGRSMTSKASDPDTLVASAKAYLGALNKIVMKRQRDIPAAAAS